MEKGQPVVFADARTYLRPLKSLLVMGGYGCVGILPEQLGNISRPVHGADFRTHWQKYNRGEYAALVAPVTLVVPVAPVAVVVVATPVAREAAVSLAAPVAPVAPVALVGTCSQTRATVQPGDVHSEILR